MYYMIQMFKNIIVIIFLSYLLFHNPLLVNMLIIIPFIIFLILSVVKNFCLMCKKNNMLIFLINYIGLFFYHLVSYFYYFGAIQ